MKEADTNDYISYEFILGIGIIPSGKSKNYARDVSELYRLRNARMGKILLH